MVKWWVWWILWGNRWSLSESFLFGWDMNDQRVRLKYFGFHVLFMCFRATEKAFLSTKMGSNSNFREHNSWFPGEFCYIFWSQKFIKYYFLAKNNFPKCCAELRLTCRNSSSASKVRVLVWHSYSTHLHKWRK